ncbi:hypothetical protein NQD34_014768 [Periophthalmus magnuspinnatus]|nr:hypothetical protein NQD34_014768 [Periophthalmus magnuspinnatus]
MDRGMDRGIERKRQKEREGLERRAVTEKGRKKKGRERQDKKEGKKKERGGKRMCEGGEGVRVIGKEREIGRVTERWRKRKIERVCVGKQGTGGKSAVQSPQEHYYIIAEALGAC